MANQEACELYIEQEIQDGLDRGLIPYSIGKNISEWVAKLFEVKIKPKTIEQRAFRQKQKFTTNVVKNSGPDSTQEFFNSVRGQKAETRQFSTS